MGAGSAFTGTNDSLGIQITFIASGSDATVYPNATSYNISTQGQFTGIIGTQAFTLSHGSCNSTVSIGYIMQLGAGTDFMSPDSIPVELSDVGVHAVNGTFITNYVAGSTFVSNADGSIVYNGATYAAGNFAIDAAGNGIGIVTSADLAGDFLPNYDNDFANALQIVNAGTLDNQLPEILPVNADLGEVSFDTQADKLTKPQIVIAPDK